MPPSAAGGVTGVECHSLDAFVLCQEERALVANEFGIIYKIPSKIVYTYNRKCKIIMKNEFTFLRMLISPTAKKVYAEERASLLSKLNIAKKNVDKKPCI